jgi:hypothetical protein
MTLQQVNQVNLMNPWVQEKLNEITYHCAWHAELTGIEAEALLRLTPSFTYLIRQGEKVDHFYLSYIRGEEFCHLPFTIDYSSLQWFYRNSNPHFAHDLKTFIPEIMHKEEAQCHPMMQFAKKK